jgi:hypothetical protein
MNLQTDPVGCSVMSVIHNWFGSVAVKLRFDQVRAGLGVRVAAGGAAASGPFCGPVRGGAVTYWTPTDCLPDRMVLVLEAGTVSLDEAYQVLRARLARAVAGVGARR